MSLSKRIRFEVFKRDKFTCQYCGKKAPDVVLQCDHIDPRAGGGTDELLNLVTSCVDCNAGKSDKRLSDDSAVAKQRVELERLQERQEQLTMMLEWKRSLAGLDDQIIDELAKLFCELAGWFDVTPTGRQKLRQHVRKFGFDAVADAMRISADTYFRYDAAGNVDKDSAEKAFNKISGVCAVRAASQEKPWLKDLYYIRAILRNELSYLRDYDATRLLGEAFAAGADASELTDLARNCSSWTNWQNEMWALLKRLRGEE